MYLDQINILKVFFYWSRLEGGEGGGGRGGEHQAGEFENFETPQALLLFLWEEASVIIFYSSGTI